MFDQAVGRIEHGQEITGDVCWLSGLSVEEIGRRFGKHPSTVSYWMHKYGLEAVNRDKHAAKGGIERERLEELRARPAARSPRSPPRSGRSKATVRHWLRRYGLQDRAVARASPGRAAARSGGRA